MKKAFSINQIINSSFSHMDSIAAAHADALVAPSTIAAEAAPAVKANYNSPSIACCCDDHIAMLAVRA